MSSQHVMGAVLLHIKLVKCNQHRTMISVAHLPNCNPNLLAAQTVLTCLSCNAASLQTRICSLLTSYQFSLAILTSVKPRQLFKGHSWNVWIGEKREFGLLRYDICSTAIIVHCVHMNKSQATEDTTCIISIAWPSLQADGKIIYRQKLLSITGNVLNLLHW